ncbi:MAG TPA: hypothetical protein VGK74_19700, partial [Symbiobacteriaceae bacterium]
MGGVAIVEPGDKGLLSPGLVRGFSSVLVGVLLLVLMPVNSWATERCYFDDQDCQRQQESSRAGSGPYHVASEPTRNTSDFSWVDPSTSIVVNGNVVHVGEVRRDLWGGVGIEYGTMADALDLYSLKVDYRKTDITPALAHWDEADVVKSKECIGLRGGCPTAPEVDKVWLYIVDPGIQTRKRPEAKLQLSYEKEIFIGHKNADRTRNAQGRENHVGI